MRPDESIKIGILLKITLLRLLEEFLSDRCLINNEVKHHVESKRLMTGSKVEKKIGTQMWKE